MTPARVARKSGPRTRVLIPRAGSARDAVARKRDKLAATSPPPAVGVPGHPHPVPRARAEGRTLIGSGAHQVAEKEQCAGRAAAEARGDTAARGDHGCGRGTESGRRGLLLLLLLSPPWPPKPRAAPLHGEAARIPAGTGHLVQGPAPARGATFPPAPGRRPAARGATCRCHRTRRRHRRHRRSRRRPRSPNRAPAPPRSQSRPLPPSASLPSPPPWSFPPNPRRPPLLAVGAHTGGDLVVPPPTPAAVRPRVRGALGRPPHPFLLLPPPPLPRPCSPRSPPPTPSTTHFLRFLHVLSPQLPPFSISLSRISSGCPPCCLPLIPTSRPSTRQ
jgi:hypothetical protein